MHGVARIDVYEDIALINFRKIPAGIGLLADISRRLAAQDINIDMISQTAPVGETVGISFTCPQPDMVKALAVTKELGGTYPTMQPLVSSGNCKITLSGDEMRTESGVFARAMEVLVPAGVEIQQITTSETQISLLIAARHLEEAKRALSTEFGV